MNLLKPTANLFSNIMANSAHPSPEVGMGATELMYTDRHAFTVVEVVGPKSIVVQQDNATRTDENGMSDAQQYEFTRNLGGRRMSLTLRSNGRWVVKGEGSANGRSFAVGHRSEYHDYTF